MRTAFCLSFHYSHLNRHNKFMLISIGNTFRFDWLKRLRGIHCLLHRSDFSRCVSLSICSAFYFQLKHLQLLIAPIEPRIDKFSNLSRTKHNAAEYAYNNSLFIGSNRRFAFVSMIIEWSMAGEIHLFCFCLFSALSVQTAWSLQQID